MALNDWRLVQSGPRVVRWQHKENKFNEIDIAHAFPNSKKPWDVGIPGVRGESFKTRAGAVQHARSYMRTHKD